LAVGEVGLDKMAAPACGVPVFRGIFRYFRFFSDLATILS
jgi:hypothetical protein